MFWEQLQFLITQICFLLLVYLHMCGSRGRGVLGGILVLMVYVWPFQCNRSTHECRFNSHICFWEISLIPEVRLSFRNRIRISLKGILNKHTRPLKHCHSWIIRFQWTLTSKFELGNWSPSLRKIKKLNEKKRTICFRRREDQTEHISFRRKCFASRWFHNLIKQPSHCELHFIHSNKTSFW